MFEVGPPVLHGFIPPPEFVKRVGHVVVGVEVGGRQLDQAPECGAGFLVVAHLR
ncbi:MAG TPA: hypothetical protein VGI81_10825 [Tepidisphaeraceae bacterium]|jgi:hypothetical protein